MNQDNSKTNKIAMIGHKRVPSREGGVEIVVWELSKRLVKLGYIVDIYNRGEKNKRLGKLAKEEAKAEGINIFSVPTLENGNLNAFIYTFFASIRSLFGKYDIIHFHAEGPCLMIWLPKLFGIKTVATIHGLDWERSKWGGFATKVIKHGEKNAAKYADEIIVLSKNIQNYFMTEYNRETVFVPNGISRPTQVPINLIEKKYGLQKNGYIYTLCRLVPEKGLHYLVEAYKNIDTDKKLLLVGGESNSKQYMADLRKLVAEDDRIIMTGFLEGDILKEICANAYAYVLPSDVEGMSISLLEAMSYGNCCIVSDIKENTEVVEDKALTFRKGDVEDLRDKLLYILNNSEAVEKYKNAASDFICNKYSWEKVTEKTDDIYQALING